MTPPERATAGERRRLHLATLALAEAKDFLGLHEKGGPNRGPAVEFFQKLGEIEPGQAWCAAFVNACVEIASGKKNLRSTLERIPLQGYVQSYVEHAEDRGWMREPEEVEPGDLFALYFPNRGRFAHIGFVYDVPRDGQFSTIEGNTDDEASREGIKVASRVRDVSEGTVFFRWWE